MNKKSLVMYASRTGNTEKVAQRFKKVFESKGWECDLCKVEKDMDVNKVPDTKGYDFLCLGSPVYLKLAAEELRNVLIPAAPKRAPGEERPKVTYFEKVIFGPDSKKGVAFVTYSGLSRGPEEAEPVLSYLSCMMQVHQKFQCVGKFACPGKHPGHAGWYQDLDLRPSERDLMKAEIFLADILEDL